MLPSFLVALGLDFVDDENLVSCLVGSVAEPYPSDSPAFSGIAEVDSVALIPRLDRRDGKGYLALVIEALSGVSESCFVAFTNSQKILGCLTVPDIELPSALAEC